PRVRHPVPASYLALAYPVDPHPLPLHDALPIYRHRAAGRGGRLRLLPCTARMVRDRRRARLGVLRHPGHRPDAGPLRLLQTAGRSEEHTSELQSRENLVCRLLLEKKNDIAPGLLTTGKMLATSRGPAPVASADVTSPRRRRIGTLNGPERTHKTLARPVSPAWSAV